MTGASARTDGQFPGPGPRSPVLEDSSSQYLTTLPVFAVSGCASPHLHAVVAFFLVARMVVVVVLVFHVFPELLRGW